MNIRRLLSYLVVAVLGTLLWITWNKEHPKQPEPLVAASSAAPSDFSPLATPSPSTPTKAAPEPSSATTMLNVGQVIDVKTDLFDIKINLTGGNVVSANLLAYPESISDQRPVALLSSALSTLYLAESGLTNTTPDKKVTPIVFEAAQTSYTLAPKVNQLVVSLQGKTENGLHVVKNYTFTKNSYAIKMDYTIKNVGPSVWSGRLYTQLVRKKPEEEHHLFYARAYDGAAVSSKDRPYYKLDYSDMDKAPYQSTHVGGWIAMQQHYFLSAWIPENKEQTNNFYSQVTPSGMGTPIYTIGFFSDPLHLEAGESATTGGTLYVGPEIAKNLAGLAEGLDRTIDYGWLWWVSIAIFGLMSVINSILSNWGWTIVVTTILIKFILYPLSATSFRSMAKMRALQPKMQQLKERFADDRQAMSRATMELYRNEKINPLGGCLPMLIQIPIFIGLYYVIIESVQLRQAPFILWILDLSVKDPYYVLPVLMGVSMLIQQKLTPASPDPVQAKMMMFVPVVFTVFFINFPAGLTLYWLVNNCVQILQQWYVGRTFDAHQAKKAKRAKAKKKNRSLSIVKK